MLSDECVGKSQIIFLSPLRNIISRICNEFYFHNHLQQRFVGAYRNCAQQFYKEDRAYCKHVIHVSREFSC